ncbi:MAG TPA: enolase C-terminal domain-like protein [Chloroflexota bacterium]|nr:enolase C-terminal domain-like protein [Chloroflexota bacterium]
MRYIARIEILTAQLPFRFSFGHALAARRASDNVYVGVTLNDGSQGWGEGVPRDYVTGETAESAVDAIRLDLGQAILGQEFPDVESVPAMLLSAVPSSSARGAAWCAVELAALDACGKSFGCSVRRWLGPDRTRDITYDLVFPFADAKTMTAVGALGRALGFRRVKVKVGADLERDVRAVRLLRRLLGPRTDIRVDANCGWTSSEALAAIEQLRPFDISCVEQPVPADDIEGLQTVTAATPETIMVDESLRTLDDAEALIEARACDAFNIRVSKCGGLLTSVRIAHMAEEAGLDRIVGAQVGESGLLSAAGRHLAAAIAPRYVEGSAGSLLLKEDLTRERVLPGWGGHARPSDAPGLGVTVKEAVLRRLGTTQAVLESAAVRSGV